MRIRSRACPSVIGESSNRNGNRSKGKANREGGVALVISLILHHLNLRLSQTQRVSQGPNLRLQFLNTIRGLRDDRHQITTTRRRGWLIAA